MSRPPASLRTTLAAIAVIATTLALVAAGAVIALTATFQKTSRHMVARAESVRFVEEAEIDLLLHGRTQDRVVQRGIEGDLRRTLVRARRVADDADAIRALEEAAEHIEYYFAAAQASGISPAELDARHARAYDALERLVAINLAQVRAAEARAARWSRLADIVGMTFGLALVSLAGWLVWWLRVRAFRPVFALTTAMVRFGRGDREARVAAAGPAEVREIAGRFNEMAATLAAQRRQQMTFLAGVAHDLRGPLAALRISVERVTPGRPMPPEPQLRSIFERVLRQIGRLERMLVDFIDQARIEAGALELRPEPTDVAALCREVVELFAPTSPQHHIVLTLSGPPATLRGDPVRIEQVITNLVSNAIKYSPEGGKIELRLETSADAVILRVSDHGVGLSDEDQRRLFEPFCRAGSARDQIAGVGVGLSVVRRIIEAHGGRIEVDSAVGRGSMFMVVLPRHPRARS